MVISPILPPPQPPPPPLQTLFYAQWLVLSPHVRESKSSESGKNLHVESGILSFGIRNTAQRIRNPTNDWNPESKFH